jgi:hypothetical protein
MPDVGTFIIVNGWTFIIIMGQPLRRLHYCEMCYKPFMIRIFNTRTNIELIHNSLRINSDIIVQCIIPFLHYNDIYKISKLNMTFYSSMKKYFQHNFIVHKTRLKSINLIFSFLNYNICRNIKCKQKKSFKNFYDTTYLSHKYGRYLKKSTPTGTINMTKINEAELNDKYMSIYIQYSNELCNILMSKYYCNL